MLRRTVFLRLRRRRRQDRKTACVDRMLRLTSSVFVVVDDDGERYRDEVWLCAHAVSAKGTFTTGDER